MHFHDMIHITPSLCLTRGHEFHNCGRRSQLWYLCLFDVQEGRFHYFFLLGGGGSLMPRGPKRTVTKTKFPPLLSCYTANVLIQKYYDGWARISMRHPRDSDDIQS